MTVTDTGADRPITSAGGWEEKRHPRDTKGRFRTLDVIMNDLRMAESMGSRETQAHIGRANLAITRGDRNQARTELKAASDSTGNAEIKSLAAEATDRLKSVKVSKGVGEAKPGYGAVVHQVSHPDHGPIGSIEKSITQSHRADPHTGISLGTNNTTRYRAIPPGVNAHSPHDRVAGGVRDFSTRKQAEHHLAEHADQKALARDANTTPHPIRDLTPMDREQNGPYGSKGQWVAPAPGSRVRTSDGRTGTASGPIGGAGPNDTVPVEWDAGSAPSAPSAPAAPETPGAPATPTDPRITNVPSEPNRQGIKASDLQQGDQILHPVTGRPITVVSADTSNRNAGARSNTAITATDAQGTRRLIDSNPDRVHPLVTPGDAEEPAGPGISTQDRIDSATRRPPLPIPAPGGPSDVGQQTPLPASDNPAEIDSLAADGTQNALDFGFDASTPEGEAANSVYEKITGTNGSAQDKINAGVAEAQRLHGVDPSHDQGSLAVLQSVMHMNGQSAEDAIGMPSPGHGGGASEPGGAGPGGTSPIDFIKQESALPRGDVAGRAALWRQAADAHRAQGDQRGAREAEAMAKHIESSRTPTGNETADATSMYNNSDPGTPERVQAAQTLARIQRANGDETAAQHWDGLAKAEGQHGGAPAPSEPDLGMDSPPSGGSMGDNLEPNGPVNDVQRWRTAAEHTLDELRGYQDLNAEEGTPDPALDYRINMLEQAHQTGDVNKMREVVSDTPAVLTNHGYSDDSTDDWGNWRQSVMDALNGPAPDGGTPAAPSDPNAPASGAGPSVQRSDRAQALIDSVKVGRNPDQPTVHLQGIGKHPAKPVSEFQPGDKVVHNYGEANTVVSNTDLGNGKHRIVLQGKDDQQYTNTRNSGTLLAHRPGTPPAEPPGAGPAEPVTEIPDAAPASDPSRETWGDTPWSRIPADYRSTGPNGERRVLARTPEGGTTSVPWHGARQPDNAPEIGSPPVGSTGAEPQEVQDARDTIARYDTARNMGRTPGRPERNAYQNAVRTVSDYERSTGATSSERFGKNPADAIDSGHSHPTTPGGAGGTHRGGHVRHRHEGGALAHEHAQSGYGMSKGDPIASGTVGPADDRQALRDRVDAVRSPGGRSAKMQRAFQAASEGDRQWLTDHGVHAGPDDKIHVSDQHNTISVQRPNGKFIHHQINGNGQGRQTQWAVNPPDLRLAHDPGLSGVPSDVGGQAEVQALRDRVTQANGGRSAKMERAFTAAKQGDHAWLASHGFDAAVHRGEIHADDTNNRLAFKRGNEHVVYNVNGNGQADKGRYGGRVSTAGPGQTNAELPSTFKQVHGGGGAPRLTDDPGKITKLTGPNSVHSPGGGSARAPAGETRTGAEANRVGGETTPTPSLADTDRLNREAEWSTYKGLQPGDRIKYKNQLMSESGARSANGGEWMEVTGRGTRPVPAGTVGFGGTQNTIELRNAAGEPKTILANQGARKVLVYRGGTNADANKVGSETTPVHPMLQALTDPGPNGQNEWPIRVDGWDAGGKALDDANIKTKGGMNNITDMPDGTKRLSLGYSVGYNGDAGTSLSWKLGQSDNGTPAAQFMPGASGPDPENVTSQYEDDAKRATAIARKAVEAHLRKQGFDIVGEGGTVRAIDPKA